MSNENILKVLTGDQALQEGRGSIILPDPTPVPEPTVPTVPPVQVADAKAFGDALVASYDHEYIYETPELDEAEHEDPAVVKTYNSLSEIASPLNLDENSIVIYHNVDGTEDITVESDKPEPTVIPEESLAPPAPVMDATTLVELIYKKELAAQKNVLNTQDYCPMKADCNHRSADYCKQAKLEADHRDSCRKEVCDCFHPARGIPNGFRSIQSGDGRIG